MSLPVPPCAFCGHVSEDPADFRVDEVTGLVACADSLSCEFDARELASERGES